MVSSAAELAAWATGGRRPSRQRSQHLLKDGELILGVLFVRLVRGGEVREDAFDRQCPAGRRAAMNEGYGIRRTPRRFMPVLA